MNFSTIYQNLESIDYSWKKPKTYLVFVPGLSLLIQKIQIANVMPLIKPADVTSQNIQAADEKYRRFGNICKWHLRGSLIQIIASVIAIKTLSLPLFVLMGGLIGALAAYEAADTLLKGIKNNIVIYEFYPNGAVKKQTACNPCNVF